MCVVIQLSFRHPHLSLCLNRLHAMCGHSLPLFGFVVVFMVGQIWKFWWKRLTTGYIGSQHVRQFSRNHSKWKLPEALVTEQQIFLAFFFFCRRRVAFVWCFYPTRVALLATSAFINTNLHTRVLSVGQSAGRHTSRRMSPRTVCTTPAGSASGKFYPNARKMRTCLGHLTSRNGLKYILECSNI